MRKPPLRKISLELINFFFGESSSIELDEKRNDFFTFASTVTVINLKIFSIA